MKFELLRPLTIEEAVTLLGKYGEETKVLAGGQSLLLMIRSGLLMPRYLLTLDSLKSLAGLTRTSKEHLSIGALVAHCQIWGSQLVREQAGILVEAVGKIGSTPVRNFGTIGGNLCHNEVGSDPPPALLVLDANVECVSVRGKRKIPLSEFFTGYFETCMESDEILVGIEIPPLPQGSHGVYLKHTNRSGDLAIVGVAALLKVRDGYCEEIKLALGGVGPVPFRAVEAENILRQRPLSDGGIDQAAAVAAEMSDPLSDTHASSDYRRKMVRVFVKRAIWQAIRASEGKRS